jgi:archaellum component FlaG (FlaF/FlaG flagellin family)
MAEAITEMIFLIVGVSIAISVISVVVVSTERMNSAVNTASSQIYDRMSSKIKIINDPLSMSGNPSEPMIVYVQNIGVATLNANATLLIDGEPKGCKVRMLEGTSWEPSSILCLETEHPRLVQGIHRMTVIAENGISDSMEFRV